MRNKKGEWEWEKLGKWILALLLLFILLLIIIALSGKGEELLEKLKDVIRVS